MDQSPGSLKGTLSDTDVLERITRVLFDFLGEGKDEILDSRSVIAGTAQ